MQDDRHDPDDDDEKIESVVHFQLDEAAPVQDGSAGMVLRGRWKDLERKRLFGGHGTLDFLFCTALCSGKIWV